MSKTKPNNAGTVGNQFGYLCPKCGQGDSLSISAKTIVRLYSNGTEDAGDHTWDDDSSASCGACDWEGTVGQLRQADNFEEGA
jgi:hypothetical protein